MTGQANALRLTVGQGSGSPVDRDVLQSHIVKEFDTAGHFAEQFTRNLFLTFVQFPLLDHLTQRSQRHPTDAVDGQIAEANCRRVVSQSTAATRTTFDFADQRLHFRSKCCRQTRSLLERGENSLELKREQNVFVFVRHIKPTISSAVEHHPALTRVELVKRTVVRDPGSFCESFEHVL